MLACLLVETMSSVLKVARWWASSDNQGDIACIASGSSALHAGCRKKYVQCSCNGKMTCTVGQAKWQSSCVFHLVITFADP